MKYLKRTVTAVFIVLMLLSGYEAFAVIKAKLATPGIFAKALNAENVKLAVSDLSNQQLESLLAIEDPNFYEHCGVDFTTPGAGLTTITQAMVKYLYFDNFRPGFKKIEQTLIAWLAVTPTVSKDDQLTVFINTAYLGTVDQSDVRGFADAARVYYAKPWNELTNDQYLSIVAMLIGPNAYSIRFHPEQNKKRVNRIKQVLSGKYQPKGLQDVFYGQDLVN